MSYLIERVNDNAVSFSGPIRESDGEQETGIPSISVTLKDPDGNPLSGLTALSALCRLTRGDYQVVLPGSALDIPAVSGYTLQAAATGPFASRLTWEDVPCMVVKRQS